MSDQTTVEEKQKEESRAQITRRRFLTTLFAAASAIGLGAFLAPLVRFAYPVVTGPVFERLRLASVEDITPEGVRFEYQEVPGMLIQKQDGSFAAFSLVCTHLGCIVRWDAIDREFKCPCHAGFFDEDGEVISGPPPRPLNRFTIAVENGGIFVEGIES